VADAPRVYPVALRLAGRPVLVVGGGEVAARKIAALLEAGAEVTVIAPEIVASLGDDPRVRVEQRAYAPGDVAGYRLVVVATDDAAVNQAVFDEAEAAGVWVNAADDPQRCSFVLPAVARRGPVTIAVSTGGTSPALAGWLRDRLATDLPAGLEEVVERLAAERQTLQAAGQATDQADWRRRIEQLFAEVNP
jgi:precorrin-2 dehydrogenase / sirohydrochlorin ferrochelatase